MEVTKESIYTNLQSAVGDFALNKYQVQWQRVSQMQQNASILLAIITFSITTLFSVPNIQKQSVPILENDQWNGVIIPIIGSSLFLALLAGFFLFKVIMAKIIKNDLPLPKDLYKEMLTTMEKNILKEIKDKPAFYEVELQPPRYIAAIISNKITDSVLELNDLIESNQKNYTKGLIISVFSILLNIFLYSLIILNFLPNGPTLIIEYGICLALAISSILLGILFGLKSPINK